MLIEPTKKEVRLKFSNLNNNGTDLFQVVGVPGSGEEIEIQVPIVADADIENDTHWTIFVYDDTEYKLDSGNLARAVVAKLSGRIFKPTSDAEIGVIRK